MYFFFFKQKTAYEMRISDWSSDVCSSDLRAAQGALCFGAFKQDEIIGCLWLCLSGYEEDEVRCCYRLAPAGKASWDFAVYLAPAPRRGLGFAPLWHQANASLAPPAAAFTSSRFSAFKARKSVA